MRRADREVTDPERIKEIMGTAKVLHLAIMDDDYPYIVPLHYGYEKTKDGFIFYMHSAKEGHKLDLIRKDSRVCIELECDVEMISGKDTPCMYSAAFASILARGRAEIVSDGPEKIHGLKRLMKNQTGRDFAFDEKMASSVAVIKVVTGDFSAKENTIK